MSEAFEKAKEQLGDLADLLHTWHAPMTDEEKLIASNAAVRLVDEALESLESQNQALQEQAEKAEARKDVWHERFEAVAEEARALQEALAFYAEPRNHEWQQIEHENGERYTKASSLVDEDAGARARDALSPTQETDRRCPTCRGRWVGDPEGSGEPCGDPFHSSNPNLPTQETDPG